MLFITGATGFTGSHLIREVRHQGIKDVKCLIRNIKRGPEHSPRFDLLEGDLESFHLLNNPLKDVRTIIHLAASIKSDETTIYNTNIIGTRSLIDEAIKAGVEKGIFISTDSVRRDFRGSYENSKLEGEEIIINSGIKYTILRPGMVYGPGDSGFIGTLIKYVQKYPVIPVIGNGNYKKQPIYVLDLINAILSLINNSSTDKKIYELGGSTAVSFNEMIDTICSILNKRRIKLHIPKSILLVSVKLANLLMPSMRFSDLKVRHACRDSIIDYREASRDFGFSPLSFAQGLKNTLAERKK